MELSSSHEEVEIPVPINSAFVGIHNNMHVQHGDAHMIHHHHHSHDPSSSSTHNNNHNHNKIIPSNNNNSSNGNNSIITAPLPILEEEKEDDDDGNMYDDDDDDDGDGKLMVKKKKIKYKECQKNHAASIGGNARDGCGEFMASGEEGSLEYLICSACNCHRNFHRKHVIQGGVGYNNNNKNNNNNNNNNENYYLMMQSQFYPSNNTTTTPHLLGSRGRKVILGTEGARAVGPPRVPFSRSVEVNMPYTLLSDRYDDHHHGNDGGGMMMMMHHHHKNNDDDNNKNKKGVVKKRFRTKFSQEQKEKMYEFAEKVGWKIQKQEESVVQQFCQQIGIRRRVLKVWMHNNKHNNMAKIKNHHNHIININNNNSSS